MAVYVKGIQGSSVPETNILKLCGLWVKSEEYDYADTSATTLFKHPANIDILGIQVDVSTAFDGDSVIQFGDGTTANLYGTVRGSLKTARSVYWPLGYNKTSAGSIVATLTVGGSTAGACNVWLHYRANSNEQKYTEK
jgi:hypothetical protein